MLKLVATIGPKSEEPETFGKILEKVDGIRLNLKHGDFEEHRRRILFVRNFERKTGKLIPVIGDIPGVEIRTINREPLKVGETLNLLDFLLRNVAELLEEGIVLSIDDGNVELLLEEKVGDFSYKVSVIRGSVIEPRKTVNFKGKESLVDRIFSQLSIFDNPKNKELIDFCLKEEVDIIALSFAQTKEQVKELRDYLVERNANQWIMVKIEDWAGIRNLEKILDIADSVMVARGDLAINVGFENLPFTQEEIIKIARKRGKQVLVATQFAWTYSQRAFPLRSEAIDVYCAYKMGADGIVLTNETAMSNYPYETVEFVKRIIENIPTERLTNEEKFKIKPNSLIDKRALLLCRQYSLENFI